MEPLALLVTAGFALVIGLPAYYLAFLTILTFLPLPARLGRDPQPGRSRFAVLVPAHNEELLIGATVASLLRETYPRERFSVHVVADNCTDATAARAREAGACVHERTNPLRRGKGAALNWLLERVTTETADADAYVVVDADSTVSANFLAGMDEHLRRGADAVQALCLVTPAGDQPLVLIRELAYHLRCHLRPLAHSILGLPSAFANGMTLSAALAHSHRWNESAVTEDGELFVRLVREGRRIAFANEATVHSAMPRTFRDTRSQALRHERGRFDHFRSTLALIPAGIARRDLRPILIGWGALIPPFTVHAAACVVALALAAVLGWIPLMIVAISSTLCLLCYVVRGAALGRMKTRTLLRILLLAPVYTAWKLWIIALVAFGVGRGNWSRTRRLAP